MPILNYTTSVEPTKTVGEIQSILAKHGVRQISIDYSPEGMVDAVRFMIIVREMPINFRLPCNVQGVYKALCNAKKVPYSKQNTTQARRVAWRIIKDWIEAQLALVEARQAEMAEVFLPYVVDGSGTSIYTAFIESKQKLLTAGDSNVVEGQFRSESVG